MALSRFGTASHHKHYFGGKPGDFGFTISDDAPLHLIYAFDTSDPLIPFESEQALFPFFYGFAFGGQDIAYQVRNDDVHLILPEDRSVIPDFPLPGFPDQFERHAVTLKSLRYDPRNRDDALLYAAFLGLEHIDDETLEAVAAQLDEFNFWDDEDLDLNGLSQTEYLRIHPPAYPLSQGHPDSACVNAKCCNYKKTDAMSIIAHQYFTPEATNDLNLWNPNNEHRPYDEAPSLIFQMCRDCETVYVFNDST